MDALQPKLPADVRIFPLVDSYPSGDEFVMVNDITKRIIPPGGLPKDVGCVVMNVETLMNIGLDQPVTHKYLTVAGAVADPITLAVPIGITIGEVIEAAGGATVPDFGVLLGGAMMGKVCTSLDEPVTKTLGGIIVLPCRSFADHALQNAVGDDPQDRQIRLRPVPLLHRPLPALSPRPSHRTARRDARADVRNFE